MHLPLQAGDDVPPALCSSIPAGVDALAGRLTVALELLAQLLGAVQLQPNVVLPLLRTVSQILTVQDLQMLQVKAIGVTLTSSAASRIRLAAAKPLELPLICGCKQLANSCPRSCGM